jgi:hypothetical protein
MTELDFKIIKTSLKTMKENEYEEILKNSKIVLPEGETCLNITFKINPYNFQNEIDSDNDNTGFILTKFSIKTPK